MSVTRSSTSAAPAGRNDAAGPQPTNSNTNSDASGHPTSTTSSTIPTPDSPSGLEHDNSHPNGSTTPPRDGQHSHTSSPSQQTGHNTAPLSPNGTTDPSLVHDPSGTNDSFSSSIDGSPNGSNASAGSSTAAVGGDGSSPMELVDDDIGGTLDIETGDEYSGEDYMQDLRRVKVYELVEQQWKDLGTAFCSGEYDEQVREAQLIAKSEETQEVLLQITVRADDVYQRQADTLIVWTEPDGKDYALSFQDVEGCTEVWEFITEVRRHLRTANGNELDSSSPFQDPNAPNISPNLPVPTLGNLQEIERQIRGVIRAGPIRERVAENVLSSDLIRKLIALMSDAEDLQSIEDLQAICTLMQAILLLNNQAIYEYILRDDIFIDMVGLMEYDPEFPRLKAHYREFLRENTKHHQVVEIRDASIRMKVHQTYRLQYLKDVVLARVLDDPIFNVLNSLIIFNQIDIVNYIQNEEYFLKEVFSIFLRSSDGANDQRLRIEGTPADGDQQVEEQATQDVSAEGNEMTGQNLTSGSLEDRRPAALLLLHQFCSMGKSVQLPMRLNLFRALVDRGILYPVQWALGQEDVKILNTAGEILAMVLDHDAGGVRGHILRQVEDHAKRDTTMNGTTGTTSVAGEQADSSTPHTLLAMMSSLLTSNRHEMSLKSQLAESFRTLMDVPGIDNALPGLKMLQPPNLRKEDQQSDRFLDYFYKICAADLYKPILENVPEHKHMTSSTLELTRAQSDLYLYLCDLLCGFMLQHSYQSHFFVLGKNIAVRIASLLYAREKHLRLAALRFFRTCLRLNNRNVYMHMTKHDVFLPILELTRRESIRDNLLSSCCQEFFEHIRRENIKDVIDHVMKVHGSRVRQLADSHVVGQRFLGLINRWEANNEPPPKPEPKPTTIAPKRWGAARAVDAEEDYFNAEEEETPATEPTVGRQTRGQMRRRGAIAGPSTGTGPTGPNNAPPSGRRQRPTSVALPKAYPIGSSSPLVDYAEEDETEALPPSEAGSDPVQPIGKQETKGPVQDGTRLRGRNRRPELTRNASVPNLDPNGVGSQATLKEQSGRRTQSPAASPSPSASSSASSEMNTAQSGIGVGLTGIGLGVGAGMAMDEDEDLIGPPVPLSLSHKRRRETEEEDETMERLAKRPFLGEQPAAAASANASKASMQEDSAGAAAPTAAAPTPTPIETPKPTGKRQLRVKLGSGANVQSQPPDVKVGDKG